jgi:hypothetical protein
MDTSRSSRLALVDVVGTFDGPWMCPRGGETLVRISALGPAETIVLEVENPARRQPFAGPLRAPGEYPIRFMLAQATRFRFRKLSPDPASSPPTTVELLSDG